MVLVSQLFSFQLLITNTLEYTKSLYKFSIGLSIQRIIPVPYCKVSESRSFEIEDFWF